jgi:type IV pilus assembly protein PilW
VNRPPSPLHGLVARGLSLVELMVGIAIGLFIVAAASVVVSSQLGDSRRLLLELQIQQDLRATADIITRELRRSGGWNEPERNVAGGSGGGIVANPFRAITLIDANRSVTFDYYRGVGLPPLGFFLDTDRGVIRSMIGGQAQDLTDANALRITDFRVEPVAFDPASAASASVPCPRPCPGGLADTSCWPSVETRVYAITIAAQARNDANLKRSIRSEVRLRNDRADFGAAVCPA